MAWMSDVRQREEGRMTSRLGPEPLEEWSHQHLEGEDREEENGVTVRRETGRLRREKVSTILLERWRASGLGNVVGLRSRAEG